MNKKNLVIGLSVLAVMVVSVAALIAVLFGGGSDSGTRMSRSKRSEPLFCAVPSNAVAVVKFADLKTAADRIPVIGKPGKGVGAFISAISSNIGQLPELSSRPMVVSMSYSRELVPLFIFDAGASEETAMDPEIGRLREIAGACGLAFTDCDCSRILSVQPGLRERRILLVSPSDNVVNSSLRHLNDGVSVYDSEGFSEVQDRVCPESSLFVSVSDSEQILPEILGSSCRKCFRFLASFSGWAGFEMNFTDSGVGICGTAVPAGQTDFVNVLASLRGAQSELFGILPSYTVRALSLPMDSVSEYGKAYDTWLDGLMRLSDAKAGRSALAKANGISPEAWLSGLGPEEVAVASFRCGDALRTVNLVRGRKLRDSDGIQPFSGAGCLAALFGDIFKRDDESCSFARGGWLITGSREAVEEWSSGRASEYSLRSKLCDAGLKSSIPSSGVVVAYFSANEDAALSASSFTQSASDAVSGILAGCDIMPMFLCISSDRKSPPVIEFSIVKADMKRSKAPAAERDVRIDIPEGPFTVKNSASGKNNTLVQNANMTISLKDENGKGMWTVPFSEKLCGTVSNVDYFGNGKIQFLFGAGSKIHLLDRLGRFVSPFPVDLGKKIVLGPAVFDFSGAKRYNILVLHDDNSIRVYNLQGKVPQGWRDITSEDTVVALPELLTSGRKSFWVVRTSRQTLVFPFMGGAALTDFSGDDMLLPDTAVKVGSDGSLSGVNYRGKTVKIKTE